MSNSWIRTVKNRIGQIWIHNTVRIRTRYSKLLRIRIQALIITGFESYHTSFNICIFRLCTGRSNSVCTILPKICWLNCGPSWPTQTWWTWPVPSLLVRNYQGPTAV